MTQALGPSADGGLVEHVQLLLGSLGTTISSPADAARLTSAAPAFGRDAAVFATFALALFVLNWGLRWVVVEPFARKGLSMSKGNVQKFAQSALEMTFYGSFAILGLMIVPRQEFFWPSSQWWVGFADGGHEVMRADLRCYYLLYGARYFQGGISVMFEHKRKDFVEMQIHHWVTVVLIFISYAYGWNRIGCVVMLLLDPADVPLHTAKLCKYASQALDSSFWQTMADILFAFFAVLFLATRLVLYPYVCWSAHIEATLYFPKGLPEWTCVVLLETLLVLQVYWFSLIVKVVYKMMVSKNGVSDERSDSEDETNGNKKKKH